MRRQRMWTRGAAMVETAIAMSLALMLILGTAQFTMVGMAQMTADSGAFVAAHSMAMNPTASPVPIVQGVFPGVSAGQVSTSSGGTNLEQGTITQSPPGLSIPGYPSSYTLYGSDLEASVHTNPQAFVYSVSSVENNYCFALSGCTFPNNRTIRVAQTFNNGNTLYTPCTNTRFAEWCCHYNQYAKINFPNAPAVGWNPGNHGNDVINSWDTGTTCT